MGGMAGRFWYEAYEKLGYTLIIVWSIKMQLLIIKIALFSNHQSKIKRFVFVFGNTK